MLPLLLVYTLFIVYETRNARKEAIHHVERLLTESTEKHASLCDTPFFAGSKVADTLAVSLTALDRIPDEAELYALVRGNVASNPGIVGSCIAFEPDVFRKGLRLFAPFYCRSLTDGSLVASDLGVEYAEHENYTTWAWYDNSRRNRDKPPEEQKGSWCEAYFYDGGGGILMCTYSAPFFRDGRFAGVATVDISLERVREDISQITPDGVTLRLFSSNGTLLAAPKWDDELIVKETVFSLAEKYGQPQLAEIGRRMLSGKSGVAPYDGRIDDRKVWIAYGPLPFTGGALLASIPESTVLAPVHAKLIRSILVLSFVLLTIAGIIVVVSYRITTPIKRLAIFAGKLAGGDLDAQVGGVHSGDEIGQLASAFDKMVVDLKSNVEQLIREESARKTVEGELRVARRIQASLLPRIFPPFPERTEFELHAMNEPAAFIAGDFFDFFFLDGDTLGLVIADVSGHGVPAAMFMAVSRTAIRNFSLPGRPPKSIMKQVNDVLCMDNDDMMFVTVFYAHYNVRTGELVYVNAGHNPPYLLRKNGDRETLEATGPLLAAFEEARYDENRTVLDVDDVLMTFTDGVTEAHTAEDNVLYGEPRLEELLRQVRTEPVEQICERVYRDVDRFSRRERHDDITLMVLRRRT